MAAAKKSTAKKSTAKKATKKSTKKAPAKKAAKKAAGKKATKKAGKKSTKKAAKKSTKKATRKTTSAGGQLVVGSRIKEAARANNIRVAGDFADALNDEVNQVLDRAIARAKSNNRGTVRPGDL